MDSKCLRFDQIINCKVSYNLCIYLIVYVSVQGS